jgi:hypothetical protein
MRASQPKNVSVSGDGHVNGIQEMGGETELRTGRQIDQINREPRTDGADHPYVLLLTVPRIGWVLAFTIASRDRRHHPLRELEFRRWRCSEPFSASV